MPKKLLSKQGLKKLKVPNQDALHQSIVNSVLSNQYRSIDYTSPDAKSPNQYGLKTSGSKKKFRNQCRKTSLPYQQMGNSAAISLDTSNFLNNEMMTKSYDTSNMKQYAECSQIEPSYETIDSKVKPILIDRCN